MQFPALFVSAVIVLLSMAGTANAQATATHLPFKVGPINGQTDIHQEGKGVTYKVGMGGALDKNAKRASLRAYMEFRNPGGSWRKWRNSDLTSRMDLRGKSSFTMSVYTPEPAVITSDQEWRIVFTPRYVSSRGTFQKRLVHKLQPV